MTAHTIEDAIEALRKLPPERQAELADFIYHLATEPEPGEAIDPDHLDAVLEGVAQARRGEFATPQEVEAAFERFGK